MLTACDFTRTSKPFEARYTAEEDAAICALVREHGVASRAMFKKEAKLMPVLEGRSAAAIRDRWRRVLRMRLEKEAAGGARGNAAPVASGATEDGPIARIEARCKRIEAAMQAAIAAAPSSPSGAAADETVSLLADSAGEGPLRLWQLPEFEGLACAAPSAEAPADEEADDDSDSDASGSSDGEASAGEGAQEAGDGYDEHGLDAEGLSKYERERPASQAQGQGGHLVTKGATE